MGVKDEDEGRETRDQNRESKRGMCRVDISARTVTKLAWIQVGELLTR